MTPCDTLATITFLEGMASTLMGLAIVMAGVVVYLAKGTLRERLRRLWGGS